MFNNMNGPILQRALQDAAYFVERGMWTRIYADFYGGICMEYGNFMYDGRREVSLVTRGYYMGEHSVNYVVTRVG
jgi:hypothetical protein